MKIVINQNKKLDKIKQDIESVKNSIKDIMTQGDSKVKINFDKNF